LSDQTEKPKGALPKGYDANTTSTENTPSTEVVKQKKINFLELVRYTSTDQDQREKDLKEYETSYIARLEKNKPEESSDDFRVDLGVSTESDDDLGKLNLRKHTVAKREELQEERLAYEQKYLDRYAEPKLKKKASSSLYKPEKPKPKRNMKKERKEYEQKYLSRYKQPKPGVKKLSNLKHDIDAGALTLRQYINAKRKTKQYEIKKYEQKYLSRYKQPKTKKKASSSLYKPEIPKPKRNMKKERKEYEQKYLSRYKQPKLGVKKLSNLKHDIDAGALTLHQYINAKRKTKQDEIKKYEQKYLSRYNQPKTKKNSGSDLYKPEIPKPKRDMKKERKEYEQKYLSRYKQPKSEVKKSTSWTQHDVALGRLTLSPHFNAKRKTKQNEIREYEKQYLSRYKEPKTKKNTGSSLYKPEIPKPKRNMQKERKEYEQKYLSRYKQPKSGVKKSSNLKADTDIGRLTLSQYVNAKRKAKQDEIREYEKQYLSRYKQPKPKKWTKQLEWEPEPKQDMKKERKEYESEFLTRYRKQQKAKPKKKAASCKLQAASSKLDSLSQR